MRVNTELTAGVFAARWLRSLWSAKFRPSPAYLFKRPPSPGDTRDVSRQEPMSSLRGTLLAVCAGGYWPELSPGRVPECQALTKCEVEGKR